MLRAALKLLIVATKSPEPPVDGGRLLLRQTLEGLAAVGVRPVLVAPVDPRRFALEELRDSLSPLCEPWLVPARLPSGGVALARALASRRPLSIARHSLAAVRREVARRLASAPFDAVHAEQLQALPQTAPAAAAGLPVLLRAQNVESDLWAGWAAAGRARAAWLGWEARRLARFEGEAVVRAAAVAALSPEDAARLWQLAEAAGAAGAPSDMGERIHVVPAPFPARLPAGEAKLAGEPAYVLLGSGGWMPNEDSAAWFVAEAWPSVRGALPGAVLHLFGVGASLAGAPGVAWHAAPGDSTAAFAAGSIHVVPLRLGSGIRMKILEAWARGIPVVATPRAISGLAARDGRELLVGPDAAGLADACVRLGRSPALAATLAEGGRLALSQGHDPAAVARRLLALYREMAEMAR